MNKILFAVGLIVLFALSAAGFEAPALTGRVVDQTGTLKPEEKESLEKKIIEFEKKTRGQFVAALLAPVTDASIEEVGIALMDKWKIGHKGHDNGAILVLIPTDRKMRLEIGYGWEGPVNDAKAGDILRLITPSLKKNDYAGAVALAVDGLSAALANEPLPEIEEEGVDLEAIIAGLFFILLIVAIVWFIPEKSSSRRRDSSDDGSSGSSGGGGGGFEGGGGSGGGGGASGSW